ncbi:MAG: sensor domain-containing diguanylate cyclase [Gammaproteobacteria bacterium]|nr:sensor domain-containing diguanylate cyclase [Gammaproteobacteria bacterium]
MYQIPELLTPKIDGIMELFVDDFLSTEFRHEHFKEEQLNEFRKVFYDLATKIINATGNLKEADYKKIAEINLNYGIPYVVIINELGYIKSIFIHELLEIKVVDGVIFLCELFDDLSNKIASIYLENYIQALHKRNSLRLKSLSEMQNNYLQHYEAHILWLDKLVFVMENQNTKDMPELNPSLCIFGQWLKGEGKASFSDEKKYDEIITLHKTLHFIASKIENMISTNHCDCHAGMIYLEKAEFISLEIGTELALLDNKMIMLKSVKDPLTDVLNRSLLEQLFYDQCEFSFVTGTSFVLAMCDLDHFKSVNDTYGHNEGDYVLKLFANILKDQLRASDLIFRYGGDEFLLILPASNKSHVKQVLNNISQAFTQGLKAYGKINFEVTLSSGLLEITPSELTCVEKNSFKDFINQVDNALYRAKANGRNRIE